MTEGGGGGVRGKALAVFPDIARGNLQQIKAAGEGYSKCTPWGRILRELTENRRRKNLN